MKGPAHLAEAMRAVRQHYGIRRIGPIETRAEVLNAARKSAKGSACDLSGALIASLEVATGLDIADLAKVADGWSSLERRAP